MWSDENDLGFTFCSCTTWLLSNEKMTLTGQCGDGAGLRHRFSITRMGGQAAEVKVWVKGRGGGGQRASRFHGGSGGSSSVGGAHLHTHRR